MSMRNNLILSGLSLALIPALSYAQDARTVAALPAEVGDFAERMPPAPPQVSGSDGGFGTEATAEAIATINIAIQPGGTNLPDGSGSYEVGIGVYNDKCSYCHGENLEGIKDIGAPALLGGRGTLTTDAPFKTVESYWPQASTLFDYVHRAMPMDSPGSLTPDEVYAVTAYILGEAGILDTSVTLNAANFADIEMPNEDGFYADPRPDTQ